MPTPDRRPAPAASGLFALALLSIAACGGSPAEISTPKPPPPAAAVKDLVDGATFKDIDSATRSVEASLRSASAWTTLGETYEIAAMRAEAEAAYLSAFQLAPDEPKHAYRAAIVAEAQGETERALASLETVLGLDPNYGPAWRRKGAWLLDLGRSAEAREAFEVAAKKLAGRPDAFIGLARTALLDDDIEGALGHARTAFRLAKEDPYVQLILGEALRRAGLDGEAAPHLSAGQGSSPSYTDPWSESIARRKNRDADLMVQAKKYEAERNYTGALAAYEEVLSRRPDDTGALLRRGTALLALGRIDDSVRHFDKAVQRFPGDYDLLVGQVTALRRMGSREDAFARAETIVERWPDRPTAFLVRGEILNDLGRVGDARKSYRRAAAIAPKDLRPQMFEARMLLRRKRAEEAAAILTAAIARTDVVPSMIFFQTTLQAQLLAGSPPEELDRTYLRAVELHGDEAKKTLKKKEAR